jgi:hypothetical protein
VCVAGWVWRNQWKKRIGEETGQQLYINDQAVFNRAFHNVGGFTPLAVPENDVPPPVAGKDPHWDRVNVRAVYHMKRIPEINESTTIGTCSALRALPQSIRTSLALAADARTPSPQHYVAAAASGLVEGRLWVALQAM